MPFRARPSIFILLLWIPAARNDCRSYALPLIKFEYLPTQPPLARNHKIYRARTHTHSRLLSKHKHIFSAILYAAQANLNKALPTRHAAAEETYANFQTQITETRECCTELWCGKQWEEQVA